MRSPVTDFMRESALFMSKDRPDVYPQPEDALEELTHCMGMLVDSREPVSAILFTSYILVKVCDEDHIEWNLTRKLASATMFLDTAGNIDFHDEGYAASHVGESGTMKVGIDLPDIAP